MYKPRLFSKNSSQKSGMRLSCVMTQRAKLLDADWSMKRVFFLNFACAEGKTTCSRMLLPWQLLIDMLGLFFEPT